MTLTRQKPLARLVLAAALLVAPAALALAPSPAWAQNGKNAGEGFFDLPVDPDAEEKAKKGDPVPGYLLTAALSGLAIFIVCKSSRR